MTLANHSDLQGPPVYKGACPVFQVSGRSDINMEWKEFGEIV